MRFESDTTSLQDMNSRTAPLCEKPKHRPDHHPLPHTWCGNQLLPASLRVLHFDLYGSLYLCILSLDELAIPITLGVVFDEYFESFILTSFGDEPPGGLRKEPDEYEL